MTKQKFDSLPPETQAKYLAIAAKLLGAKWVAAFKEKVGYVEPASQG